MLIDSNIIIYAFQPQYESLRAFLNAHEISCSLISKIETLGYHRLSTDERFYLERFFASVELYPISREIANAAIGLRQQRKFSLGDAIIAATAIQYRQTLVTHNSKDFTDIEGLAVFDPLA